MQRKIWALVIAAWFCLWGLLAISTVKFEMQNFLMGILAIAGGVLLILDR